MFGNKVEKIRDAALVEAKAARAIAEKADGEGRSLTGEEKGSYDGHMVKAARLTGELKAARADEELLGKARGLYEEVNGSGSGRKGAGSSAWVKAAADGIHRALITEVGGQKALVTGTIGVPAPIDPNVVTLEGPPRSILDLIPAKGHAGGFGVGNAFSFLRQTVRTNNAAPVADGALKPTSIFTLEEIEDRFRVIAHLSEPVPERYFADYGNLQDFLRSEMEAGILAALEAQVVSGDGTGENFTGILATSGIVSQAFATDTLTTIRKGLTSLQAVGVLPTALVLNPVDLEALDLLRDGGATGRFLLGDPAAEGSASIWSIPRVPSTAVAAGTGILADWGQAEIEVREDATLAFDRSGANFTKNLVTARVEGRFGLAVKRPRSFVSLDLTAA